MSQSYFEEAVKPFSPATVMEEVSRCLLCIDPPCSKSCPAGTDPGKFIRSLRFKNVEGAACTIRINNALGSVCARVCPTERYCQKGCLRSGIDRPLDIGRIQSFLTDYEEKGGLNFFEKKAPKNKKIALVGGGPSALQAAATLAIEGYSVEIYEKDSKLGGYLRGGIPEYRLPTEILDKEIQRILDLDVKAHLGVKIGEDISLDYLKEHFDAVCICTGFSKGKTLEMFEGKEDTITAVELLKKLKADPKGATLPEKVLVIGGGDVAMDAVCSLKMLGAKKVIDVVYEELPEMRASEKEVKSVLSQADSLICGYAPVSHEGHKTVFKHRFLESELTITSDLVVLAVGQTADVNGLSLTLEKGEAVGVYHSTSDPKVFFAGDLTPKNEKTVVYAVKTGKEAAWAMINRLEGKK